MHPDIPQTPGQRFDTQQGVGQGTVIRRRRNPRTKVDDTNISQADGLSLGTDGNYHPIETTPEGEVKVKVTDVASLLGEMIDLQKRTLFALSNLADLDYEDLINDDLPNC